MIYQKLTKDQLLEVLIKLEGFLEETYTPSIYTLQTFTKEISGKRSKSIVDLNFLHQAYVLNRDNVMANTLDVKNIQVPKLKTFEIKVREENSFKTRSIYDYEVETYSTDERVLVEIAEGELLDESDPYYNESNYRIEYLEKNYGNSEIDEVEEVKKTKKQ